MRIIFLLILSALFLPSILRAQSDRTVIVISLDGFPAYALEDPRLPMPTLRKLMREGAYADTMQPIDVTVTWPNHTAMITGVSAAKHGVLVNGKLIFGKQGTPPLIEPWVERSQMVHAPTIYDVAAQAGLTTAQVDWVAIYQAKHIQWRFPELPEPDGEIEQDLIAQGTVTADQLKDFNKSSSAWRDQIRIDAVTDILAKHHPNLLLLHLTDLDNTNHAFGPMSGASYTSMKCLDDRIKDILDSVQRNGDLSKTTLFVVSDHGFRAVKTVVRLNVLLREKGLVRGEGNQVTSDAWVISEGGSALVYVTNSKLKASIIPQLQSLFANAEGVDHVYTPDSFASLGLPSETETDQAPVLFLTAKPDYSLDGGDKGALAVPGNGHGSHGYANTDPKMGALFVAWGAGIRNGVHLNSIRNVDLAPTLASLLNLNMKDVDGRVLTEILR